jgi:hypothetical protein
LTICGCLAPERVGLAGSSDRRRPVGRQSHASTASSEAGRPRGKYVSGVAPAHTSVAYDR